MLGKLSFALVLAGALVTGCGGGQKKPAGGGGGDTAAASDPAHDPAAMEKASAQYADLKKSCDASADARAQRQAAKPLYQRLGGHDAIHAVMADVVAIKETDPVMKRTMVGVDKAKFIDHITDFFSMATGGPEKYTGKDVPTAHAKMNLTDVDFMAAGAAVMSVLGKYKVPAPEQEEVVCALVGLHDQVVQRPAATAQK